MDKKYIESQRTETQQILQATPAEVIANENEILTIDDAILSDQGLPPQQYDAFVLFADEDVDFATEIIEKMEEFGLKVSRFQNKTKQSFDISLQL